MGEHVGSRCGLRYYLLMRLLLTRDAKARFSDLPGITAIDA